VAFVVWSSLIWPVSIKTVFSLLVYDWCAPGFNSLSWRGCTSLKSEIRTCPWPNYFLSIRSLSKLSGAASVIYRNIPRDIIARFTSTKAVSATSEDAIEQIKDGDLTFTTNSSGPDIYLNIHKCIISQEHRRVNMHGAAFQVTLNKWWSLWVIWSIFTFKGEENIDPTKSDTSCDVKASQVVSLKVCVRCWVCNNSVITTFSFLVHTELSSFYNFLFEGSRTN